MSSETAIRLNHVSKCYHIYDKPHDRLLQMLARGTKQFYREFWALQDLSFEITKGETVGIVGQNGSGKSTLLQLICGTLAASSGDIDVNGRIAALLELGSGFNPEFTGRENVYMNGAVLGLRPKEIDERFDAIAAFADIGDFIDQPVRMYSSGMFVRLAFAVAVHVSPDILIVDEALAVGDIRFQVKCQKKFQEFREEGKTMILVSHSAGDIVRLCDRAIWLSAGRMCMDGAAKRVMEYYHADMAHNTGAQSQLESAANGLKSDDALVPIPSNATITGDGGVRIVAAGLYDERGRRMNVLSKVEKVQFRYLVDILVPLDVPFFAFQIVNSKGVRVSGSNTLVQRVSVDSLSVCDKVLVCFSFDFPELENGEYLLAIGVGDGSAERHIRHAFVSDAYVLQVLFNSSYQEQAVLLKLPDCVAEVQLI